MMVSESAIDELKSWFRGQLFTSTDPHYEDAREIWNSLIDRRPLLVARCAGPADAASAIRFACEHGIEVAIRGGAHHVAGYAGGCIASVDLPATTCFRPM